MFFKIFFKVFSKPFYLLFALLTSTVVLLFVLWLPNFRLLILTLFSSQISFLEKVKFVLSSFAILNSNFTPISAFLTIIVAFLAGINFMILIYAFREQKYLIKNSGGLSAFGLTAGLLGMGCASCGSLILSLVGFSGAITILPLGGQEFYWLAIILLIWSLYLTLKKINKIYLKSCPVAPNH